MAFPFFKAWKPARHSVTDGGGIAVQLEVYRQYFSDKLYGLGVLEQCSFVAGLDHECLILCF